jgi:hypothetical protein
VVLYHYFTITLPFLFLSITIHDTYLLAAVISGLTCDRTAPAPYYMLMLKGTFMELLWYITCTKNYPDYVHKLVFFYSNFTVKTSHKLPNNLSKIRIYLNKPLQKFNNNSTKTEFLES